MSGAVAVVDDNIALLDSMKFLLATEGYDVVVHGSPAAFLEHSATGLACLIVDQQMPGMKGLELVARLRQDGNHIPVLLMSGLLSTDILAHAARLGVNMVLEKPPEEKDLLRFVRSHV